MTTRTAAVAAAACVAVGLGAGAWFAFSGGGDDRFAQCRETRVAGGAAAIGGPFALTDHTGARVAQDQVLDQPALIYFGYTFCPDVCPLDTARMVETSEILAERDVALKPVFITIDPERDTVAALSDYVTNLGGGLTALTGSAEDIAAAAQAYRVYYRKAGEGEDYLMDHSSLTYLMAPGGGFLEVFRRDLTPMQVADKAACFIDAL